MLGVWIHLFVLRGLVKRFENKLSISAHWFTYNVLCFQFNRHRTVTLLTIIWKVYNIDNDDTFFEFNYDNNCVRIWNFCHVKCYKDAQDKLYVQSKLELRIILYIINYNSPAKITIRHTTWFRTRKPNSFSIATVSCFFFINKFMYPHWFYCKPNQVAYWIGGQNLVTILISLHLKLIILQECCVIMQPKLQ